jgi:hypothetical protein
MRMWLVMVAGAGGINVDRRGSPSSPTTTSCNLALTMADLTQILPFELLAEILGHASAPDLLRFKKVSR